MITNATDFNIVGFRGGLVTNASDTELELAQSPSLLNCIEGLNGRLGFSTLNASAIATGSSNGIWDFGKDANTRYLIAVWGNNLFKMDYGAGTPDGTWDDITEPMVEDDIWEFDNFSGNAIMCSWSQGAMLTWDGITATAGSVSGAPSGAHLAVWENMVLVGNINGKPDRVQRSALGSHTDWSGVGSGWTDIRTTSDHGVRALRALMGRMYIFKKKSIHRMTYLGGSPIVQVKEVVSGTGTIASRTVQYVDDPKRGPLLVFLTSSNKLMGFTGYQMVDIGDKIGTDLNGYSTLALDGLAAETYSKYSHAIVDATNGWYILFCVKSGDTKPAYAIVWDYIEDSIWLWDNMNFRASTIADLTTGPQPYTQGGSYSSTFLSGTHDNGSAINVVYYTGRYGWGSDNILKKGRHVELIYKDTSGDTFDFHYRMDMDTSTSSAIACASADKIKTIDIPEQCNMIQYVIRDNSASAKLRMHKLYTSAIPLGRARR